MSKSKENWLQIQQQEARRDNEAFQHHINQIKNAPSPAELQKAALGSISFMLDSLGCSDAFQATIRGFVVSYGEAAKMEAADALHETKVYPDSYIDHALMVTDKAEMAIS